MRGVDADGVIMIICWAFAPTELETKTIAATATRRMTHDPQIPAPVWRKCDYTGKTQRNGKSKCAKSLRLCVEALNVLLAFILRKVPGRMVNARLAKSVQLDVNRRRDNLIRDQVEAFVHRKVFRIEETMARPRAANAFRRAAPDVTPAATDTKIVERELAAIFEAIDKSRGELAALTGHSSESSRVSRSGHELSAAIGGMGQATEKILSIAEGIDEGARALTATLQDSYKRGVAQEIQDQVVQIFETCHFQDLAGQRINNAIATLKAVETHVARLAEIWGGMEQFRRHSGKTDAEPRLLNGPKLDGDSGHANQADVDRLFG